jgi:uncharacterized protein
MPPAGFPHPHASEDARLIAENGVILRVQVGSGVHGTSITGQDDRDEMGLCLKPPRSLSPGWRAFRTAPAGRRPGWVSSSTSGIRRGTGRAGWRTGRVPGTWTNPTVLLVLFVPDDEVVFREQADAELTANAGRFVSRLAADRYLGYLKGQKAASPTANRSTTGCTAAT